MQASHVPGLQARDGLAAINGSNMLTAMSALWLVRCQQLAQAGRNSCFNVARGPQGKHEAIHTAAA
ncbi:MAG: aromatic amino acid ammonia-lyase [Ignavibacteriales bacterium]|nr:aromatic amino acid ammonia-lyase [Ignavibacteriales bacterium]